MKRTLVIGAAFWLVACHSNPKSSDATSTTPAWQQAKDTVAVIQEHPQTAPEQAEPAPAKPNVKHPTTTHHKTESSGATSKEATSSNNTSTASAPATATEEKKGWSKTAKGAVLGGVVGAGAGAIIDKNNRGAGAVIGGVVGAGAGAIIGNQMDKKDGRH